MTSLAIDRILNTPATSLPPQHHSILINPLRSPSERPPSLPPTSIPTDSTHVSSSHGNNTVHSATLTGIADPLPAPRRRPVQPGASATRQRHHLSLLEHIAALASLRIPRRTPAAPGADTAAQDAALHPRRAQAHREADAQLAPEERQGEPRRRAWPGAARGQGEQLEDGGDEHQPGHDRGLERRCAGEGDGPAYPRPLEGTSILCSRWIPISTSFCLFVLFFLQMLPYTTLPVARISTLLLPVSLPVTWAYVNENTPHRDLLVSPSAQPQSAHIRRCISPRRRPATAIRSAGLALRHRTAGCSASLWWVGACEARAGPHVRAWGPRVVDVQFSLHVQSRRLLLRNNASAHTAQSPDLILSLSCIHRPHIGQLSPLEYRSRDSLPF